MKPNTAGPWRIKPGAFTRACGKRTTKEIAQLLECTEAAVRHWKAEKGTPSMAMFLRWCDRLKRSPSFFFERAAA